MLKIIKNIEFVSRPKKIKNKVDNNNIIGDSKVTNQKNFIKRKN